MSVMEIAIGYGGNVKRVESVWTEERTKIVEQLWADGWSATHIGARMGVSRNAVIGKVHRLGLPGRIERKPKPYVVTQRRKPRAEKIKIGRQFTERQQPSVAEVIHIAPDPACKVHFLDATPKQCRFPLWADYTPLHEKFYCGAVMPDELRYCRFHHHLTHHKVR